MATNQEAKQTTVRASTSTTHPYNGDWMTLFDNATLVGTYNERLLQWINAQLGTSYTNVNHAMQAYAVNQSAASWSALATFSIV